MIWWLLNTRFNIWTILSQKMHLPTELLDSPWNNLFTAVSRIVCTFLQCKSDKLASLSIVLWSETAYLINVAWRLWILRRRSKRFLKGKSKNIKNDPQKAWTLFQGNILEDAGKDFSSWGTEIRQWFAKKERKNESEPTKAATVCEYKNLTSLKIYRGKESTKEWDMSFGYICIAVLLAIICL